MTWYKMGILAIAVIAITGCAAQTNKTILQKEQDPYALEEAEGKVHALEKLLNNVTSENSMTETQQQERTTVVMKTTAGDITIELFNDLSPVTVKNFLTLVEDDFYDGILFHRVIPDFMIQGGDPLTKQQPKNWALHGTGGPGYTFNDEFNSEPLVRGSLAMANAGPNTNGSQFFIVTAPATPWLDGRHTNFGRVIEGMEVVDAIQNAERNERDHPLQDIAIIDISIQ